MMSAAFGGDGSGCTSLRCAVGCAAATGGAARAPGSSAACGSCSRGSTRCVRPKLGLRRPTFHHGQRAFRAPLGVGVAAAVEIGLRQDVGRLGRGRGARVDRGRPSTACASHRVCSAAECRPTPRPARARAATGAARPASAPADLGWKRHASSRKKKACSNRTRGDGTGLATCRHRAIVCTFAPAIIPMTCQTGA